MKTSRLLPLTLLPALLFFLRCTSSPPPPSGSSSGSGGSPSSGTPGSSGSGPLAGQGGAGETGGAGSNLGGAGLEAGAAGEGELAGEAGQGGNGDAGEGGKGGAGQGGSVAGGNGGGSGCKEGEVPCDDLCLPNGQACDHATIEFAPRLVAPYEIFKDSPYYGNTFTLDLDQDGKDEIFVVLNDPGFKTRRVRFNGTTLEKVEDIEGMAMGYGDFDNKNGPDLILSTGLDLYVLENDGSGKLKTSWTSKIPPSFLSSSKASFVNLGQGKHGILLHQKTKIGLLTMDEQKEITLVKEMEIPITSVDRFPLIVDVNQDGISDLVFLAKDGVETWLGTGSSFAFHNLFPIPYTFFLIHFNKDPFLDLFHSSYDAENKPYLDIYFGLSGGGFVKSQEPLPSLSSAVVRALPGDFDGDGRTDLHVRLDYNTEIWRGNGKGGFNYKLVSSLQNNLGASHLGDMNGDGLPDLVEAMSIRINITKKLP